MFLTHIQWYVDPKIAPSNPWLWVFMPLCNPSPERGLDQVTYFKEIEYGKSDDSGFTKRRGLPPWVLCPALSGRCQLPHCKLPVKDHMARRCGRPPGTWQWETQALRPTAHKELNSANSHVSEPEVHPSLSIPQVSLQPQPASDYNLMRGLESEAPR